MSVSQSNLTSMGYDLVVAVTQDSINTAMLEYLSQGNFPVFAQYYNQDANGNPVAVDLATLLTQTNNTNPFDVPNWNSTETPVPASITNIDNSSFWYAFQAQLGLPPGYTPTTYPNIITLNPAAQTVTFTLLCSQFQVVAGTFGRQGLTSYLNSSQPSGDAWLFTSTVPLQSLLSNNNLPPNVQAQLDNYGANAFSVQQLLYDFDNAALESVPVLTGVTQGTPLANALNEGFIGAYFTAMQQAGQPVLGYSINTNNPSPFQSSLIISDMNFETSQYTPPSIPALNTFNYVCGVGSDTVPATLSQFPWNWIETTEESSYNGAIAISKNIFTTFLNNELINIAKANCYLAYVHVVLSNYDTECTWSWSMTPDQQPTTNPASGTQILSYSYSSSSNDQAGEDGCIGSMTLTPSYSMTVNVSGSTMTIVQNLTVYCELSSMGDDTAGNIVNKTITDVYTLSVNGQGQIQVGAPVSTVVNSTDNLDISSFMSFFNDLNNIVSTVENYANQVTATALTDVPVSTLNTFVFPGGSTFSFADIAFSDYQDLVSHIVYDMP